MEQQFLQHTQAGPVMPENGQLPGSLALAFLGDTIYDLYVRSALVPSGGQVKKLHQAAAKLVNATAQSAALERVEGILTEEEADVVRRGRNAKQSPPKNADPGHYHRATGFEALIGYLYLMGKVDRLDAIMKTALSEQ